MDCYKSTKDGVADPPKSEEFMEENGPRSDVAGYTNFADRMIHAAVFSMKPGVQPKFKYSIVCLMTLCCPQARSYLPYSYKRIGMQIGWGCMTMPA